MFKLNPAAPSIVNTLAEQFGGYPISWRVGERAVTIVFEHGPKVTFDSVSVEFAEPTAVGAINFSDGINELEASVAGRALGSRKKKGK
jgi:hypothetical protein